MMFFDKKEWRYLWPFYLETFLGTILFMLMPFMVAYFSSLGFSASRIGILMSAWPLAYFLLEIPTGAVADLYGRKFSVMLGYFLEGVFGISIFFMNNFFLILLFVFLLGGAGTLTSGSYEAWVVDLLKKKKMSKYVSLYFSKHLSVFNLALVISGIVGALLVQFLGLRIIWLASGAAFFISLFVLSFAKEEYKKKKMDFRKTRKEVYRKAYKAFEYCFCKKALMYLLIIAFIVAVAGSFRSFISWTFFLKEYNFPDYALGYLWSVMSLLGVGAPLIAEKLSKGNKERKYLILISFITLIYGFFILFVNSLSFLIIMILISSFIFDFRMPLSRTFFHRFLVSRLRSTSGSIEGMLEYLAFFIATPIIGVLLDSIGAKYTVFIASLFMIPVIWLYFRIKVKG